MTAPVNDNLFMAISDGDGAMVVSLLEQGADPNAGRRAQRTPLTHACILSSSDIVGILIRHGADVNLPDDDHESPLWVAAWNEHPQVVQLLIDEGARVDFYNPEAKISLERMSQQFSPACAQILSQALAVQQSRTLDQQTPLTRRDKSARRI